jgi:tetratricopeptide (TPR) repeat protein
MREQLLKGLVLVSMGSSIATAAPVGESRLGQVHFPNSCKPEVQGRFLAGVALLHSFEFTEAEQAFSQVETDDPQCVIAAWGMALSETQRSGARASQKDLAAGWIQLQPWLATKAGTDREQMYLNAVRAMYEGYDKIPADERDGIYLAHMQEIRRKYPEDVNASLFYAIRLAFTAGSGKEGLEKHKEALAILLPIFKQYPNNPGAAHYIIHAADIPELAPVALSAAREYAAIAPDAPHALHMPSHIFNRLGYWKESISANEASARVAAEWIKTGRDGTFDELHALNNLEYGYLQLGQDQKARQIVEQIEPIAKTVPDPWLPVDARIYYDLETHDWLDAAKIEPPSDSKLEENFDAYWIQTIAAAHLADPHKAEQSLELYRKSETAWNKEHGWGDVLGLALMEAESWTMFSEGKHDEAINHLRDAAQYEHDHPMYYADILPRPTQEMLGDMLLQMGRSTEALAAYKTALVVAPNRLDSLLGARTAASGAGNVQLSDEYAEKIRKEGGLIAPRP